MSRLLILLTPLTSAQTILAYVGWLTVFNGLYLALLWIFGLIGSAPIALHLLVGCLACLPFLFVSMQMLTLHLKQQTLLVGRSSTDLLTGLPSRGAFVRRVEAALPCPGAIMLVVDVDHFKSVNDRFGHAVGDKCLKLVADNMRPILSGSYMIGRIGGEEFAIFLIEGGADRARHLGQLVSRGVRLSIPGTADVLLITSSVGATEVVAGDDLSEVLRRADHALYRAKEGGRARMVFDTDAPPETALPNLISGKLAM